MGMRCKSAAALSTVRRTSAQYVTVRQPGREDEREEESKPGDQPAAVDAHFRRGNGALGPPRGLNDGKQAPPAREALLLCRARQHPASEQEKTRQEVFE